MDAINDEWDVDEDGDLVGRGYYFIELSRLNETCVTPEGNFYSWPLQIAGRQAAGRKS